MHTMMNVCAHSVVSDSETPGTGAHQAPPCDFPGKNTGVRCNFLLQVEIAYYLRPLEGGWFRVAVHPSDGDALVSSFHKEKEEPGI